VLVDIVVDANVFLHAHNPSSGRQDECQLFLALLRNCEAHICVDEGYDPIEAKNKSQIWAEYLKHLRFGMVAFEVVAHLARSSRIDVLPRRVSPSTARTIHRQVTKGPDRTYVKVAFNSQDRTLTSHDFADIPQTVRRRLRESLEINVISAADAVGALQS
jgi:hypothetical protein